VKRAKHFLELWKRVAPFLVGGLLTSLIVLYTLAEFHEELSEAWLTNIDQAVVDAIHRHVSPMATQMMLALTFIGSIRFVLPIVAVVALWRWLKHCRRDAFLILVAVGGSAALNIGLKLYFHRQRPDVPWALSEERSFSFPSGHSVAAITLYGILAYWMMKHFQGIAARAAIAMVGVLVILGIGVSRIYLGVHYASDVASGYLGGLLWLSAIVVSDLVLRQTQTKF
jgi:undecaprenyl-diphosphatase